LFFRFNGWSKKEEQILKITFFASLVKWCLRVCSSRQTGQANLKKLRFRKSLRTASLVSNTFSLFDLMYDGYFFKYQNHYYIYFRKPIGKNLNILWEDFLKMRLIVKEGALNVVKYKQICSRTWWPKQTQITELLWIYCKNVVY